jgi:hypothetical protein
MRAASQWSEALPASIRSSSSAHVSLGDNGEMLHEVNTMRAWMSSKIADALKVLLLAMVASLSLTPMVNASFVETGITDPLTYNQAVSDPVLGPQWSTAAAKEFNALVDMQSFEYVPEQEAAGSIMFSKWVFKAKTDRLKARIVVCGNSQNPAEIGEVYAPTARMTVIRAFFAHAASKGYTVRGLDVSSAFLHCILDTPVYMRPPKGYERSGYVLKLKRSLYGLKESPRRFNKLVEKKLAKFQMTQSSVDDCLYTKGPLTIVFHVDDFAVSGPTPEVDKFFRFMKQEFRCRDLGTLDEFVGMEISQSAVGIKLHHSRYIRHLLRLFDMEKCQPVRTPMVHRLDAKVLEGDKKFPFRELVGSIMYLAHSTRPDLALSASELSAHCNDVGTKHVMAAKRTLRYLAGTQSRGIFLPTNLRFSILGYSDSDFAGDLIGRRSTSGRLLLVGGAPLLWAARRQRIVATSSAESEYVALSEAGKDVRYCRSVIRAFSGSANGVLLHLPEHSSLLLCDNSSALKIVRQSPGGSKKTSHVEISHHSIRQ